MSGAKQDDDFQMFVAIDLQVTVDAGERALGEVISLTTGRLLRDVCLATSSAKHDYEATLKANREKLQQEAQ